jgi:ribosomal-protein-alanine N-acetyltransferase
MNAPTLRGERVTLRPWTDADLAPFAALNADPEVMLRMTKALSRDESDAYAGRIRVHLAEHGFATEGAMLALRHGFEVVGLPQIVSFTAVDNAPSIAVMERIGLARRGEFDHPRLPPEHRSHRHVLYAKDAA